MSTKADIATIRKQILDHLERYASSSISAYEMARVFGGISPNTVRRICEDLHAEGLVWKNQEDASHLKWQFACPVKPLTTVKP